MSPHFNEQWWDAPPYECDDPWYVGVRLDGVEAARMRLDDDFDGSPHVGAPDLGPAALEIKFFEVSREHRRAGIGSAAVAVLARQFPEQRLLALSEGADEFWASLGWTRFDYVVDGGVIYRPLFVQPAR